jgi:hypothetical protein
MAMQGAAAEAPPPPAEDPALLSHPVLQGVLPLHETSDMVLVIRLRRCVCGAWACRLDVLSSVSWADGCYIFSSRIIEGGMRDLAQAIMENYRFWYHDQIDVTSQVRPLAEIVCAA